MGKKFLVFILLLHTIFLFSHVYTTQTYIVKDGDNLWNIASSYLNDDATDAQIQEFKNTLASVNDIENPHLIHPGDEITIPLENHQIATPLSLPSLEDVEIVSLNYIDNRTLQVEINRNGFRGNIPLSFTFTRNALHPKENNMVGRKIQGNIEKQEFTNIILNEDSGWSHGEVIECDDIKMIGGYNQFGVGDYTENIVDLPPGEYEIMFDYYHIDTWDAHDGQFYFNDVLVWSRFHRFEFFEGGNKCGGHEDVHSGGYRYPRESVTVSHPGGPAKLKFTSTLTQPADNESFGIYNVEIKSAQTNDGNNLVFDFSNDISNWFAGKYDIKVEVVGESEEEFLNNVLFFCGDDDSSCDSVPNEEDVCEGEFGSPYFLGCGGEFVLNEGETEFNFPISLTNNWHRDQRRLPNTRKFSLDGQDLLCEGSGLHKNEIYFNGIRVASGSGGLSYRPAILSNPQAGEYECWIHRIPPLSNLELANVTVEVSDTPTNGVSVFDLDRDGVPYHPSWWQDRFPQEEVPLPQDLCPASFGLAQNDGCPTTNKELLYDTIETNERIKISFPDFNTQKVYLEESTQSISIGRDFINVEDLNSLNSNLIQVEVTSSCIPTIPFSELFRNDPQLLRFISHEFEFITLSENEIRDIKNSYEETINQISQADLNELSSQFSVSGEVRLRSQVEADSLAIRAIESNALRRAQRDITAQESRVLPSSVEELGRIFEAERLEELALISNLPIEDKRKVVNYLTRVSDCDETIQREDELDLFSLTSTLHLLTPINSKDKAREVINSIIDTTNQLQIQKTINPQLTQDSITTQISLDIKNIPPNTTIWQVIPKENVKDFETLRNSIQIGNADEIRIKDKDPIIGWYFGSGGDSGDIGFEIDGTGEGGSTIPIEDSLFFNYGELIVNYREFGCFDGENELFTIQNITGSLVSKNDFTYSVCIAHNTTHDISPLAPLTEQYFGIDSTQRLTQNIEDINLYKQEGSELGYNTYYALFYGRSPPRLDYSCIGSIDENTGLFGGCMYMPNNRLWIYYGDDPYPPEIDFFYVPSHSIQPRISIFDEISGLSDIKYCVTENELDSCNFPQDYTQYSSFNQGDNLVEFSTDVIGCPDVRDCEKFIRVYAQDVEGNYKWYNTTLTLLQEATSCNANCIAQPLPGRYLASCHRISGCEFMGLEHESEEEKGTTVADLCNYKVPGSWVNVGDGFEVQCPSGPMRKSRFTQIPFTIDSQICEDVTSNQIPAIIDGEEVIMHIITC